MYKVFNLIFILAISLEAEAQNTYQNINTEKLIRKKDGYWYELSATGIERKIKVDSTQVTGLSSSLAQMNANINNLPKPYSMKQIREIPNVSHNAPNIIQLKELNREGIFKLDKTDNSSIDNGATILVTKNNLRYKRIGESSVSPKWFGAKGNGIDDDTQSLKAALTSTYSSRVLIPSGSYKTNSIILPVHGIKNGEQNNQPIYYLIGEAGGYSTASLQANKGVNTLLTVNNMAGVVISNLTLKGAPDTQNILDLSWKGTPNNGAAPANLNKLENIWIEGGVGDVALNLDQFHDSKIDGITVRTKAKYALSIIGGGGYWGASNMQLYGGKARLAAQNASIRNTVFTKGVEIVGGSYNFIHFDACHFIDIDDIAIKSLANGNGTRSLQFSTCYFNKSRTGNGFIEGRYWSGATFRNCWFESGRLTNNIKSAAGTGMLPHFRFENCSFGTAIEDPKDCIYEFVNCTTFDGILINYATNGWSLGKGIKTPNIQINSDQAPPFVELRSLNGSTPYIDFSQDPQSDYNTRLIQTNNGLNILGKGIIVGSGWKDPNTLKIGNYTIWVDSNGNLRIKKGNPLNDNDGQIVGQQN